MSEKLNLASGLYVLSEDVDNPQADRRYKRQIDRIPVWKKGTRFFVHDGNDQIVPRIDSPSLYGNLCCHTHNAEVWKALAEKLVPAQRTIGNMMRIAKEDYLADGWDILAIMVDQGKLTLDEIEEAAKAYNEMVASNESAAQKFVDRHDLEGATNS